MKNIPVKDRFWQKVQIPQSPDGCWEWLGCKSVGYGRFKANGKLDQAHRFAYEMLVQKIPDLLQIDHLCRNRACVNPEHMELVSQKENVLRGAGLSAANARKTHCLRGHALSGSNLHIDPSGFRVCRTCMADHSHRQYLQKKPWDTIQES